MQTFWWTKRRIFWWITSQWEDLNSAADIIYANQIRRPILGNKDFWNQLLQKSGDWRHKVLERHWKLVEKYYSHTLLDRLLPTITFSHITHQSYTFQNKLNFVSIKHLIESKSFVHEHFIKFVFNVFFLPQQFIKFIMIVIFYFSPRCFAWKARSSIFNFEIESLFILSVRKDYEIMQICFFICIHMAILF
jgi:hypothetical protein